jgi:hypothetical protein
MKDDDSLHGESVQGVECDTDVGRVIRHGEV